MNLAWKAILFSYSGWFAFVIQPAGYVKMFAFVLIGYLFVMVSAGCIHAQEKKVSAQEYKLWYDRQALKNVE